MENDYIVSFYIVIFSLLVTDILISHNVETGRRRIAKQRKQNNCTHCGEWFELYTIGLRGKQYLCNPKYYKLEYYKTQVFNFIVVWTMMDKKVTVQILKNRGIFYWEMKGLHLKGKDRTLSLAEETLGISMRVLYNIFLNRVNNLEQGCWYFSRK